LRNDRFFLGGRRLLLDDRRLCVGNGGFSSTAAAFLPRRLVSLRQAPASARQRPLVVRNSRLLSTAAGLSTTADCPAPCGFSSAGTVLLDDGGLVRRKRPAFLSAGAVLFGDGRLVVHGGRLLFGSRRSFFPTGPRSCSTFGLGLSVADVCASAWGHHATDTQHSTPAALSERRSREPTKRMD